MLSVFQRTKDDHRFWEIVAPTGNGILATVADRQEALQIFSRRIGPTGLALRARARRCFPPELDQELVANGVLQAYEWVLDQMNGGNPPFRIDANYLMSLPSWVMRVIRYAKLNRTELTVRKRFELHDNETMLHMTEMAGFGGGVSAVGPEQELSGILLRLPARGYKREFFAVEAYYGVFEEASFDASGLVVRCDRAQFASPFADLVVQRGSIQNFDEKLTRLGQRDIGHLLGLGEKQVGRLIARGESELRELYS